MLSFAYYQEENCPPETNNYRPISILPVLSKLLELFVHSSFTDYLDEHKRLTIVQSGFRRLHSTLTSLFNVTSRWLKNIDKGLVRGVVFIGLRKALTPWTLIVCWLNLKDLGVTGLEHQWLCCYLTGRSQSVSVDRHLSDPLPVNIGVPQGLILGPLLFLLFLNDLPTVTECCVINMFADDTEIDSSAKPECSPELESNVNIDLCRVKQYCDINILSLNVQKCEFILIGTHHCQDG